MSRTREWPLPRGADTPSVAARGRTASVEEPATGGHTGVSDPPERALPSPESVGEVPSALVADVFARDCPSRRTVETIASKWGVLALAALADGAYRFNALRRRVDGVSEKMLAQTLHALERDGLVTREVQATIPPRVEYALTDFGRSAAAALRQLIDLVERQTPQVLQARARYDEARGGD